MSRLRVMTYNILVGGRRGDALHRVVRSAGPDVLLVNEGPKRPLLWRRDCRSLAERRDLHYVAGGRPAGSNLVATARGVAATSHSTQAIRQPAFQPRRGIVTAQLRVGGQLVGVVSCHLGLDADSRLVEVRRVLEAAGTLRGPLVVAGDLNEPPDGPSWAVLRNAGFVDHGDSRWRTFPADAPDRRIDALLVRGDVGVLHHGDPGVPHDLLAAGSDHRPVLAELEV